ncbi:hypothetical protein NE237_030476 [Protea cynaroides]|uniref:Cellulose synthase RING-type zinc finger domain-containing protein n=1 Tax=Protea cynaroides TaxID=273540 RepID=A0A9Q0JUW5_9MAGN|nr:hypothetical protein NE237_030476 [Protea cynaroides]
MILVASAGLVVGAFQVATIEYISCHYKRDFELRYPTEEDREESTVLQLRPIKEVTLSVLAFSIGELQWLLRWDGCHGYRGRLVANSHNRNKSVVINVDDIVRVKSTKELSEQIYQLCGDEIELATDGEPFVSCNKCVFPVYMPCYEFERRERNQNCPQCGTRYKRIKGSRKVIGDDDIDDLDNEFDFGVQRKLMEPGESSGGNYGGDDLEDPDLPRIDERRQPLSNNKIRNQTKFTQDSNWWFKFFSRIKDGLIGISILLLRTIALTVVTGDMILVASTGLVVGAFQAATIEYISCHYKRDFELRYPTEEDGEESTIMQLRPIIEATVSVLAFSIGGGEPFVACNKCVFPVCMSCYEFERRERNQNYPQYGTRYKRIKGSRKVICDDDIDDLDNEFDFRDNNWTDAQHIAKAVLSAVPSNLDSSSYNPEIIIQIYGQEDVGISSDQHALIIPPMLFTNSSMTCKLTRFVGQRKLMEPGESSGGNYDGDDLEDPDLPRVTVLLRWDGCHRYRGRLVASSHNRNKSAVINVDDIARVKSTKELSGQICQLCGDEIELATGGEPFVACNKCAFPVCMPCYEFERRERNQNCPQCGTRYKRIKGSRKIIGDDDIDDLDNEFDFGGNNWTDAQHIAKAVLSAVPSNLNSSLYNPEITLQIYDQEDVGIPSDQHAFVIPSVTFTNSSMTLFTVVTRDMILVASARLVVGAFQVATSEYISCHYKHDFELRYPTEEDGEESSIRDALLLACSLQNQIWSFFLAVLLLFLR